MKCRRHFFKETLHLSGLVPGSHSQGDVLNAGGEISFKLFDALLRSACGGEAFDELHAEVRRIVLVEKGFAFI